MATTVTFGERTGADYTGVSEDTWLDEANATTNYGSDTELELYRDGGGADKHAILKFDLSALKDIWDSDTMVVTSAYLSVYENNAASDYISRVPMWNNRWVEDEATYTVYRTGQNWNQIDSAGVDPISQGISGAPWSGDSAFVSSGQYVPGNDLDFELQAFLDNKFMPDQWFTTMLVGGTGSTLIKLHSSKSATASQRPLLSITYDTVITDEVEISPTGDYSTLAGWESGEQTNLVSATTRHIVTLDDYLDLSTTAFTLDGWTTNPQYGIIMKGDESRMTGTYAWNTGSDTYLTTRVTSGYGFEFFENIEFRYIGFRFIQSSAGGDGIDTGDASTTVDHNVSFYRCEFLADDQDSTMVESGGSSTTIQFINCGFFVDISAMGSSYQIHEFGSFPFVGVFNCAFLADATGSATADYAFDTMQYGKPVVFNCFSYQWDVPGPYDTPANGFGGYNAQDCATGAADWPGQEQATIFSADLVGTGPDPDGGGWTFSSGQKPDIEALGYAFPYIVEDIAGRSRVSVDNDIGPYQANEGVSIVWVYKYPVLTSEFLLSAEGEETTPSEFILLGLDEEQLTAGFLLALPPKAQQLMTEFLGNVEGDYGLTAEFLLNIQAVKDPPLTAEFIAQLEKVKSLPAEFIAQIQKAGTLYVVFEYDDNGIRVRHTPGTLFGETRETTGALLRGTRNTLGTLLGETRE